MSIYCTIAIWIKTFMGLASSKLQGHMLSFWIGGSGPMTRPIRPCSENILNLRKRSLLPYIIEEKTKCMILMSIKSEIIGTCVKDSGPRARLLCPYYDIVLNSMPSF